MSLRGSLVSSSHLSPCPIFDPHKDDNWCWQPTPHHVTLKILAPATTILSSYLIICLFINIQSEFGLNHDLILQRSSLSPGEQAAAAQRAERDRTHRTSSPDHKKLKRDTERESDGEKSDQDLVVDDSNDGAAAGAGAGAGATNGNHHSPNSTRENGVDGGKKSPRSPSSESSSSGKKKEENGKKSSMRSTPGSKSLASVPQLPGKIYIRLQKRHFLREAKYEISIDHTILTLFMNSLSNI